MEGQALHFELSSERHGRQVDVFRMAQLSFNRYISSQSLSLLNLY